jgi:hypothetical protein
VIYTGEATNLEIIIKVQIEVYLYTLMNGVAELWNFSTIVTKVLMDIRETSLILVVRKSM